MKLRFISAIAAGAMLTFALASPASAQGARGGPGPQGGGGFARRMLGGPPPSFLVRRKDVQKDLKLSAAQVAKIDKVTHQSFGRPGAGGPPNFAEFEKRRAKMDGEINAVLTPSQKKRLKEIGLQLSGPFAVLQPDVHKALGITASQQKQIMDALPRFGGRPGGPGGPGGPGRPGGPGGPGGSGNPGGPGGPGRPGGPGGPPPGGGPRPGGPNPRKEIQAKVDKVLTAKQRAQLKAMQGKPFTPDRDFGRRP